MTRRFDYIIAGGGSAGCALAARLAEDKRHSVCLIEAGGKGRDLFIRMPAGNGFVFGNPKLDWGYESVPQTSLNGRSIYFPRGKALGGSSIVNGMIYMRGVPADYDTWRQMGLPGWGFADLLPYFRKSEGSCDRRDGYHGVDGPLKTEPAVNFGELDKAFIDAAIAAGHNHLDDFNSERRTGVARNDSTVHRGVRQSSGIAYLKNPPRNLAILTNRYVARVLFEGKRAIGVECANGEQVHSTREVIVCQGAFGTPHVLMLSGVGPAEHLKENGIEPIVDLPGVGADLADHLDVPMQYGCNRPDLCHARHQRLDKAAMLMAQWLFNGSGPGGGAFFSTVLFHSLENPDLPELEVFMTPMAIEENLGNGDEETTPLLQRLGRRLLVRGRKVAKPGVQIDINLERPHSLGTVRLRSANPLDYPLIDPNYLSDSRDMDVLVQGVKAMRKVMEQKPIAQYLKGEIGVWANAKSDDEIIAAIRETAYTGHHPCSTARMGGNHDKGAVLDAGLKVRGVDGLRVCDASAMPSQITGNLYATVIAMAEKAADMILERDPLPAEHPQEVA